MEWFQVVWSFGYGYLLFWTAYLFLFAFAGLFYRNRHRGKRNSTNRYAIIIPAYKEDVVISKSVAENLLVNFPKKHYQLFVVADSLQQETLNNLEKLPIRVIKFVAQNSTKAKAVNAALSFINSNIYTHTIVLDADNIMDQEYLHKVDAFLTEDMKAVQTHRMAKNQNTPVAILDAMNEEIGNHIFRKGHVALGFSAALIGSGMVFQTELFKRLMAPIRDTAGEDKMLEFALLNEKIKVKYLNEALVYDEKIEKGEQFEGQRSRWVAARFFFLKSEAQTSIKKLLQGDFDYFNKWMQFLLPQKILLIANVFLFSVASLLFSIQSSLSLFLLALLLMTFAISIPKNYYSIKTLKAISKVPAMVFGMVKVLVNIKKVDPSKFNVTLKRVHVKR